MKKTITRQNIKSKDTKKNKGWMRRRTQKKRRKSRSEWFGDEISSKTQDLHKSDGWQFH
jgi:hypothetical protein